MALNLNSETTGNAISTINLSKVARGERINLSKEQPSLKNILVKLMWKGADLDISAIILNDNDTFIRKDSMTSTCSYQNLVADGIAHSGDLDEGGTEELSVNLSDIESGASSILFVATSHAEEVKDKVTFGQVRDAVAFIINKDTNEALYEIDLEEDHSKSTAVEMVRLYKKKGDWRLTSLEEDIGTHHMGLQAILDKYNV